MRSSRKRVLLFVIIGLIIGVFLGFYRFDRSMEYLEQTYLNEQSKKLEMNLGIDIHATIHYQVYGEATNQAVVLLHGLFSSVQTFYPWKDELLAQNYRVILIDLPGHGLSSGFTDLVISQERQARAVYEVLVQEEIESIFIGGNSMGGGVSWFFASTYYEEFSIKGLILIDAVFPMAIQETTSSRNTSGILKGLARMTPKWLFRIVLDGVYGSQSTLLQSDLNRYYDLLLYPNRRRDFLSSQREEESLEDALARLSLISELEIPVVVLWGKEDSWIDVSVAKLFQEAFALEEDQVIIYEGLGHVPMEEDPDQTIQDVLYFLQINS